MEGTTGPEVFAALAPGTAITIRAFKYDGREYRHWQADFAATVAGGVVVEAIFSAVVEGRTPFFGGDRAVEYFYADRGYNVIAGYDPVGVLRACYCNIATPASFVMDAAGPEIHFVDLDLDVLVRPDGRCEVTDEDDFARNAVAYAYPDELREGARGAVSALLAAVEARVAPFDLIGPGARP